MITGAADDDPSGIATYSQAGAQAGFNLLWTMVLTFPLMVAIQMVSALIGRVTGHGLARNMAAVMPGWLVTVLVALLFLANTINVGADLAAMGEAAKLVAGFGEHEFTIFFALISLGLQLFIPYRRYARFLTVLTLSLFAYVAVMFMLKLDWAGPSARGMIGHAMPISTEQVPPPPSWRSSAPPSAPAICSSGKAPRKWKRSTRSGRSQPLMEKPLIEEAAIGGDCPHPRSTPSAACWRRT